MDGWNTCRLLTAEDADNNKVNTDSPRKQFSYLRPTNCKTITSAYSWCGLAKASHMRKAQHVM